MMTIKNLTVKIGDKEILNGFDLNIEKGTVHAIMGLNGSGKSTLSKAIVGHYDVEIMDGDIIYKGKDIIDVPAEERALEGKIIQEHLENVNMDAWYYIYQVYVNNTRLTR